MLATQPDVSFSEKWIQHQRRLNRTTTCWAYVYCSECPNVSTEEALWEHLTTVHQDRVDTEVWKLWHLKEQFFRNCREKKFPKKPLQPSTSSGQAKRPMIDFHPPVRILASVSNDNISMRDASEDDYIDQPRKRPIIGSGTCQGLVSPRKDVCRYDLPRGPEARLASIKYGDTGGLDLERARAKNRLLSKGRAPPSRLCSLNLSNSSSSKASEARVFQEQSKDGNTFHCSCNDEKSQNSSAAIFKDKSYDIILQPETRPISQDQLGAEVKGIYAGLVMVEATRTEVDNKQATFATPANLQQQPEPNLEQWQALIALHGSLLHENHDFFLVSQHPSSSPALRRLASKLKRTGALTWFLLAFLGCGSTFALDYLYPPMTGRLADPFIAFAIRGLPTTLGWSFLWIAFIEQLGLAERIDNGDFDGHVGAFLQWFIDTLRHIVHITVDLFIPRLLEVWMNRFLGLNNIREQQPLDMEAGIDGRFPRHDPFPEFLGANVPIPRPRDEFPDVWGEDPEDF